MWFGYGAPAGLCCEPAYGEQEKGQRRFGEYGPGWNGDRWLHGGVWRDGYCGGGLACYNHGGPKYRTYMDGNAWCAVLPDFINLQESPSGWGDTPSEAMKNLELEIAQ